MFADRKSALVLVCMCVIFVSGVCPGEEFALAAQVSRLQCEAEVHNDLINHTRAAHSEHGAWDRRGDDTSRPPRSKNPPGGVADGEVGVFKGAAHFLFYLCILG